MSYGPGASSGGAQGHPRPTNQHSIPSPGQAPRAPLRQYVSGAPGQTHYADSYPQYQRDSLNRPGTHQVTSSQDFRFAYGPPISTSSGLSGPYTPGFGSWPSSSHIPVRRDSLLNRQMSLDMSMAPDSLRNPAIEGNAATQPRQIEHSSRSALQEAAVSRIQPAPDGGRMTQTHDTMQALVQESSSPAQTKPLDPNFKVRPKPRDFFGVGKVFMTLWSEPAGNSIGSNSTDVTISSQHSGFSTGSYGERVFSEIRRFVVVRAGARDCSALPIVTYGHQGVSKKDVVKSEHAIIYTSKIPPSALQEEFPQRGESGMLQSIRVDADELETKLDPMSRIDFAKVYTIQHNVKFKLIWTASFDETDTSSRTRAGNEHRAGSIAALVSCSWPQLVTTYKAMRACGSSHEQACAGLASAKLRVSVGQLARLEMIVNAEHTMLQGGEHAV